MESFDVVVIGGGHAGCEAAHASARMGCRTALITLNPARIGFMSCNPAMGGLAKGQLIKEIDALGGVMGMITDRTSIQSRRLNSSKGPAVRSSRAQCDKALYAKRMQEELSQTPNLTVLHFEIAEIMSENGRVVGVRALDGSTVAARAVIVTSGTFLQALMFTGFSKEAGGRAGDTSANQLSNSLKTLGFSLKRLKTGTPPRLHRASIDYGKTEPQDGDKIPIPFSFYRAPQPFPALNQVKCFITYTCEETHREIERNFHLSPMFTGMIQGIGPRYCPSVEDKVKRFRDKERHQIFLEPEGLETDEVYVNGLSTSLPREVQERFVRTIPGLERAEFIRFGYAVEYDAIDARALRRTLESKEIVGLYVAGQVNGTSGYEEAGAQGLIAGMNAALAIRGAEPLILSRYDAYMGVLIDDLVVTGVDEPYRMFTSRAEHRLLLREDNADLRLTEKGWRAGLVDDSVYRLFEDKRQGIERGRGELRDRSIKPGEKIDQWLDRAGLPALKDSLTAEMFLRRPEVSWRDLQELGALDPDLDPNVWDQVEIQVKYEGYIRRELELLESLRKSERMILPHALDFDRIPGISNEIRDRLKATRPETVGQVARMPGVTPAAVANLVIFLKLSSPKGQEAPRVRPE